MKVKLPDKLSCKRCGYVWIPRKEDVRICPKCKSARWDQEREEKPKKTPSTS